MRILFLNHVSRTGGAEASLLDMVGWLRNHDWAASVALPEGNDLAKRFQNARVPVYRLPIRRIHRRSLASIAAAVVSIVRSTPPLLRLLRQNKVALLHANSNTAHLYAILATRIAHIPLVWHCRDVVNLGGLGPWMIRAADRIVAISHLVGMELQKCGATSARLRVVHNGIDVERFRPCAGRTLARKSLGIPTESFVVTMIAQLVPWKNHPLFVEAARLIVAASPSSFFLLVGDDRFGDHPQYAEQIRRLARSGILGDRVILTGYIEDVREILEATDVLVHPASREPFGRVLIEAMAMGKPVVAVNQGGPAEIVRDGVDGILVPPENAEVLARAVMRIASDPTMAVSMGQRGRERVAIEFSLESQMRKIESIYKEVLSPREDEN